MSVVSRHSSLSMERKEHLPTQSLWVLEKVPVSNRGFYLALLWRLGYTIAIDFNHGWGFFGSFGQVFATSVGLAAAIRFIAKLFSVELKLTRRAVIGGSATFNQSSLEKNA